MSLDRAIETMGKISAMEYDPEHFVPRDEIRSAPFRLLGELQSVVNRKGDAEEVEEAVNRLASAMHDLNAMHREERKKVRKMVEDMVKDMMEEEAAPR